MTLSIDPTAVARGTQTLFNLLSSDQIQQLRNLERDPDLETRVGELARKANEGELSAAEEAEYHGYVEANSVLAILRSAARHRSPAH